MGPSSVFKIVVFYLCPPPLSLSNSDRTRTRIQVETESESASPNRIRNRIQNLVLTKSNLSLNRIKIQNVPWPARSQINPDGIRYLAWRSSIRTWIRIRIQNQNLAWPYRLQIDFPIRIHLARAGRIQIESKCRSNSPNRIQNQAWRAYVRTRIRIRNQLQNSAWGDGVGIESESESESKTRT